MAQAGFAAVNAGKGGVGDIRDTDKLVAVIKNPDVEVLSIAGTDVTSTAAELNILDGVTANAAELNMAADSSANVEVVTTTNVIAAAESGSTYFLDNATGFVSTLPAIAAGLRFKFILTTVLTSGDHTVVTSDASDIIQGNLMVASTVVPAILEDAVNFKVTDGDIGDWCELICDGTNWFLCGSATTTAGMTVSTG